jgi:hypothetical protein
VGCGKTLRRLKRANSEGRLAPELELFEPLKGFALVGDDLGLPDERDRHEAHGDDAKNKNESDVGLRSREAKNPSKPCHGIDLLVLGTLNKMLLTRIRFDRAAGHCNLPEETGGNPRARSSMAGGRSYTTENRQFVNAPQSFHRKLRIGCVQINAHLRHCLSNPFQFLVEMAASTRSQVSGAWSKNRSARGVSGWSWELHSELLSIRRIVRSQKGKRPGA